MPSCEGVKDLINYLNLLAPRSRASRIYCTALVYLVEHQITKAHERDLLLPILLARAIWDPNRRPPSRTSVIYMTVWFLATLEAKINVCGMGAP